jgi:hypothetical protein
MPERIQLRRTKGWRKPEGAIVVSRPSKWGNPWRVDPSLRAEWSTTTRELAVALFRDLVDYDGEVCGYPAREQIRAELAGHDLACWCPLDQPCHALVLLEIANGDGDV